MSTSVHALPTLQTQTAAFLSPISLEADPISGMFLYSFSGCPDYNTAELQFFDHPVKGKGAALIMARADEKVDFYMTPGLYLDREKGQVGGGSGEWITQDFDWHLEVTPEGVQCDVKLTLKDGRPLHLHVHEHRRGAWKPLTILAPMGSGIRSPKFLPAFWLHNIDLVRIKGTEASLTIGDQSYPPLRLPMPMPHSGAFAYFVRFCLDPFLLMFNREREGIAQAVIPDALSAFEHDHMRYELTLESGQYAIERACMREGSHVASVRFSPPLPGVLGMQDGSALEGGFTLGIDEREAVVSGQYAIQRTGDRVTMRLYPTENWHPHGSLRQRMTLALFPPIFRNWLKTYEWTATFDLCGEDRVMVSSHWRRVEK